MDNTARKFGTNGVLSSKISLMLTGVRSLFKRVAWFFQFTDEDRISAGIVVPSKDRYK
jgi:hypothetical protein